jgi:predicted nucleic acid-binding protein
LAEKLNISLVTADARLIQRMSGDAGLAKLMVWVGDLPG